MTHVSSGSLRRLADDPRAVADVDVAHVASCRRCTARRDLAAEDARTAASLLSKLGMGPDVATADLDIAWHRFDAASAAPLVRGRHSGPVGHVPPTSWRLLPLAAPTPALLGAAALVLVVAGAATVLTTVGEPGPAAPPTTTAANAMPSGLQQVADLVGVDTGGGGGVLGGFDTASGTLPLPFGVLHWSSAGAAHTVSSLAAAAQATGLPVHSPGDLPPGVGALETVLVQPAVTATVDFAAGAVPGVGGAASLSVTAGPAVLAEYGGAPAGVNVPTLVTVVMARPATSATSSSTDRLEAFVLARPGLPAGLVREVRLLGNLSGLLSGVGGTGPQVSQVEVAGVPGILVTDGSGVASGVLWEDHNGTVHAAAGLLDQKDVLDVANQIG